MDDSKAKLWQNYWENKDNASFNGLMNAYIHLIENIAEDIIAEHINRIPIDNLYAEGLFTLKDCIVAYPKGCNIPFSDYCREKVKQAMVEELEYWQANQKSNK